ncbi:Ion transport protein [Chloroherpeton thalassium ATCC 35110]|uniref:Ion transport protein n=1 Tax=Chloroherpeton thalassium (strain ATCC 35110 / GB-78) TaxID=517418 RepID=B3QTR0_CHLT3|nr:ion transporter [Chloroherpeton thalassium]ACF14258.1 Ion transport protein [Chloroherpeton thalassium ATCC 35110]
MKSTENQEQIRRWQAQLSRIIFGSDTTMGKLFDVVLIISIVLSVLVVMLDSVKSIAGSFGEWLRMAEWFFTILFTIEYFLRIISLRRPIFYIKSFYGIIDLLAVIPTYLSLILPGSQFFLVIRLLRVLRIFRVLKLAQYLGEAEFLIAALSASRRKITVFLFTVMTLVIVVGSLMYVIEGEENGFTSIPSSIYWAIVTLTTVGYGDISPKTGLGQALAALVMILGYGIIAVPTGIVTAELSRSRDGEYELRACKTCKAKDHDMDAKFCKHCGSQLPDFRRRTKKF